MALNSINTNTAALRAQENIGRASSMSSASIARLSSGNRITRAADDVAALSAGTSLRTNVTTLRTALINTSQGASLLQVADGALAQITDILQRQKAIAVQAGAGSLTSSERSFLNQEFQNLTAEIDRLAGQTNFNGVTLLDGSLFDITNLEQSTGAAGRATASITLNNTVANFVDGKLIIINGVTLEYDVGGGGAANGTAVVIAAGSTQAQFAAAVANTLNASTNTRLNSATYVANGNTITITSRAAGQVAEAFTITTNGSAGYTATGRTSSTANTMTLQVGSNANVGIGAGDTMGVGTIGDSIIATQNQTNSFFGLDFTNATTADFADAKKLLIGNGTDAAPTVTFEFDRASAPAAITVNHVRIDISGAQTKEDYIDAIVAAINRFNGVADSATGVPTTNENNQYLTNQVEARRSGQQVLITSRAAGSLLVENTGAAYTNAQVTTDLVATAYTNLGSNLFANGGATGITTNGITNSGFVGTVGGFSATYGGTANTIALSVTVGGRAYSAASINVTTNQTIRMISAEGDYFDMGFQGATQALSVSDQAGANLIASRLDTAFSTITFFQDREISSFDAAGDILSEGQPIGTLTGASVSLQTSDFSDVSIDDIRVSAPLSGQTNGIIEFDINGVTYRSEAGIGSELGSRGVFQFTSLANANDVLTLRLGNIALTTTTGVAVNSIQFDTANKAESVAEALRNAFGIGEGGQSLNFQVGVTTSDTLNVRIGTVTTNTIFGGTSIDVLTQASAAAASDVIDDAIDAVTSVRAEVGALQSRFDFAAANIESSIQNQEAARATLLDTDVASESTAFATAQVQLQAGISVLAQANLLPQNLLKLIG